MKKTFCILWLLLLISVNAFAVDKVVLQLRWDHQFQFAGYYAAEMMGYYDEAGLDVEIRSALSSENKLKQATVEVSSGQADFGVGAADVIIAAEQGADLKIVASVFQRSAARFYLLEKHWPVSLHELAENLRVARVVNGLVDVEFQAMLRSEGIDPAQVKPYPFEPRLDYFVAGEIDVFPGYSIGFPFDAKKMGLSYIAINPAHFGIEFCGDSLFTRGDLIQENPELVADFVAASMRGWQYALQQSRQVIDYIENNYERVFPREDLTNFNRFQAEQIPKLMDADILEPGYINPARWRAMHKALMDAGLVKTSFEELDLLWPPEEELPKIQHARLMAFLYLALIVLVAALGALIVIYLLKERHKKGLQKSHEDLYESQERYRSIVENTEDLITRVDSGGRVVYVNPSSQRYWGLSADECIGRIAFDFVHHEDRAHTQYSFQSWLASKEDSVTFENRQLHISGKSTPVLWTISAIRNGQGEITEFTSIARDIEQIRLEERVQNALVGLIDYTEDHTVKELLQKFLSHAEELTGSCIGFYHFIDEDSGEISLQTWSESTFENYCTVENKNSHYPISEAGVWGDALLQRKPVIHNDYASLPHKKGFPEGHAPICRELVVPVFRADKIVAILGVGNKPQDYTDADIHTIQKLADLAFEIVVRKQAEEALKNSEELYRLLYSETPAMMHSIDKDGIIVSVSEQWLKKMGYERGDVIGRQSTEFLTEESRRYVQEVALPKFFETGEASDISCDFIKKNGEIIQTLLSATAEYDHEGQFVRSLAVIVDVTERNRLIDHLEMKNEEMERFVYTLSHDLKSPLVTISGFLGLIQMDLESGDIDAIRSHLSTAVNATNRMRELLKDLLEVTKHGVKEYVWENVELEEIINHTIENLSGQIKEVKAVIDFPSNLPVLRIDHSSFLQVFENLIGNAIKYSKDSSEHPTIKISAEKGDNQTVICIRDNGIGMESNFTGKAFDLFHVYEPEKGGTGVGLAIVKRIVERHGGKIWIESEGLGKGTSFYISIPDRRE